ncbi:MAG: endonuclease/exonuclease/phosphatase family protein [Acidimicrobiales bacterium]
MPSPDRSRSFVVANFNLHAGIDGWGRPFDVVESCRTIHADILVLEECWTPADGPADGRGSGQADGPADGPADGRGSGQALAIGAALGYSVVEHPLATGRRAGPHPGADHRWMRPWDWRGGAHAIYLDGERPLGPTTVSAARFQSAEPGTWGIAVLSRLPVVDHRSVDLGRLPRDRARRVALVTTIDVGGGRVTVVGTHMSHLSYGSPVHFRRLREILDSSPGVAGGPSVLAGDLNLWGPPAAALLSGRGARGDRWRRAVRGRTWPAWRPHSQVDHILVRGPLAVEHAEVLPMAGSDHRPVRARLALV